ncbi:MAG: histidine phosphatase family protein [Candidatus Nanopelagicaceae bacterium]|jgi:broad specificity phosphatase PhoE
MSRIFLLRHAHSTANAKGILAGRMEGITLSPDGKKQQQELLDRLSGSNFQQVISSPIQRCIETITGFHNSPEVIAEFQEVDYGDWTGKKMSSLARNKAWREIHKHPASVRFPNGETLPEVQTRALLGLDKYISGKSKNVLISTHADVVKVLLLHALGSHLNNIDKITVDNASVSVIEKSGNDYRVLTVNDKHTKIEKFLV